MKPAQKTDLNTRLPMPTQQITLPFDRVFSADESALLKMGFLPQEMEDKWFIYFENNVLYFHRSWTGYCIYQVFLTESDQLTLRMTQATVNRDPQQYTETRSEHDALMILQVIDTFLLRGRSLQS